MTDPATVYAISEIFGPTIQGEGPHAGWPAIFLRLAGCNAWDGLPEHRANSICPFCDTDFQSREQVDLEVLLTMIDALRQAHPGCGCVLTGGEHLLQADGPLLEALDERFAWLDIETNGSRPCPVHLPHTTIICSPKPLAGVPAVKPDYWKILIPDHAVFLPMALADGSPIYLQPRWDDGPDGQAYQVHLDQCLELVRIHGCRLSLQLHKYLDLP